MLTYEIEFIDCQKNRKFSYTGVRKVEFGVSGKVFIIGVDAVTGDRYYVTVTAKEFDYFTVRKEDDNEQNECKYFNQSRSGAFEVC